MVNFILKVHEKFPENPIIEMFKIWVDKEYIPKICQHMYIKGVRANTHCKIKVKGESIYCSKHKLK